MRTTIRVDDELYRSIKAKAGRSGRTVGELIEDAIRASLEPTRRAGATRRLPALPTFGGSGVMPGVDLTSNAALLEAMDGTGPLDALR